MIYQHKEHPDFVVELVRGGKGRISILRAVKEWRYVPIGFEYEVNEDWLTSFKPMIKGKILNL